MTSLFAATRIRAVDFYRRVPKDLTEASVAGGITSLLAIVILLVLIVTQTLNYLAIQRQTDIIVDTSEDAILNINFNVTLPHVSCEWASVDLVDVIGHKYRAPAGETTPSRLQQELTNRRQYTAYLRELSEAFRVAGSHVDELSGLLLAEMQQLQSLVEGLRKSFGRGSTKLLFVRRWMKLSKSASL